MKFEFDSGEKIDIKRIVMTREGDKLVVALHHDSQEAITTLRFSGKHKMIDRLISNFEA